MSSTADLPVVDFRLSSDEQLLRDSLRELLAARWSPELARGVRDGADAADALWPELAGWVAVVETGSVATCLAAEEAGASLAPGGLLAAWAFAGLLAALEHPLADDALAGELCGGVALTAGAPDALPPSPLVLRPAAAATRILAIDGDGAALLPVGCLREVSTADLSRRFAALEVVDRGDAMVQPTAAAAATWAGTLALAAGADALGACRTLLRLTVDYACIRTQFGRPIGTFQAVRHRLVDLALALERATAATYLAAMLLDADDSGAPRAVHAARASAHDAVARFVRAPVQLHGAIGYTWEHDVHLYLRRAFVSDCLFGSGSWHRARLEEFVL